MSVCLWNHWCTLSVSPQPLETAELFLFLTYLSTGCTQRELAHRLKILRATVSRIMVTLANFLYSLLGSVCFWKSPAAVKANLPPEFSAYSDTQVILDCMELRCQTPSSLVLQIEVFSHYRSHCTFKAMVGMSPDGALTFISPLFEDPMRDKEVFRQSGIKNLLTHNTAIMVEWGRKTTWLFSANQRISGYATDSDITTLDQSAAAMGVSNFPLSPDAWNTALLHFLLLDRQS